jgi:hypothetical protein
MYNEGYFDGRNRGFAVRLRSRFSQPAGLEYDPILRRNRSCPAPRCSDAHILVAV